MEEKIERKNRLYLLIAISGFIVALLAGLAEALAGPGARWGLWHYRTGFLILRWAVYGGIGAAVISLAGCLLTRTDGRRTGLILSVIGLLAGVIVAGIPWTFWHFTRHIPAINDITTSTDNPPRFVAIAPLRQKGGSPVEYKGQEIAAKQQAAYPDIVPLEISVPQGKAFRLTLDAARSLNWEIVDADQQEGRIEATDTTFWFGFKDDIVIRITPSGQGSRIDVRSASRVGRSDLGTNAKRIRRYLDRVQGK